MQFLERLVTFLAVVTVLVVVSLVTFFSIYPLKSGIPDEAIKTQEATIRWLENGGRVTSPNSAPKMVDLSAFENRRRQARRSSGKPVQAPKAAEVAQQTKSKSFDNYVSTAGRDIPKDEQVPGIPWVRYQPGVRYVRARSVPSLLHRQLQSFQEAYKAGKGAAGKFEDTKFGPAYRITWVQPKSHLADMAGIQSGDKILSVNGRKIGNSFTAAKQLYEELKNESRLAVKVLRNGKPTVLSFQVK